MKKRMLLYGTGFAGGLFLLHSAVPSWYNKYLNPNIRRKTGADNTVMLTFDDGPDPRYTGRLLDLLSQNGVKAVFFVVLENALENGDLIDRMLSEGHLVGFHSRRHQNSMFHSFFYMDRDLRAGRDFLRSRGIETLVYRPPWGLTNLFTVPLAKKYGFETTLWSVMAQDWEQGATADMILRKLRERVGDRSLICLHDAGEKTGGAYGAPHNTIKALSVFLPELKKKGYRFILPSD